MLYRNEDLINGGIHLSAGKKIETTCAVQLGITTFIVLLEQKLQSGNRKMRRFSENVTSPTRVPSSPNPPAQWLPPLSEPPLLSLSPLHLLWLSPQLWPSRPPNARPLLSPPW